MLIGRIAAASLLMLLAVACAEKASPAGANSAPQVATNPAPQAQCPPVSGYAYLPEGVVFTFKHHVRADRLIQNRQGGTHRRVIVEYQEGTPESTMGLVKEAMERAKYTHTDSNPAPNDGTRMRFHQKGRGMVVITVYPDAGEAPAMPDAIGTIVTEFTP